MTDSEYCGPTYRGPTYLGPAYRGPAFRGLLHPHDLGPNAVRLRSQAQAD